SQLSSLIWPPPRRARPIKYFAIGERKSFWTPCRKPCPRTATGPRSYGAAGQGCPAPALGGGLRLDRIRCRALTSRKDCPPRRVARRGRVNELSAGATGAGGPSLDDSSASVRAPGTGPRRDGAIVRSTEPGGADRIDPGARRPRGVDLGFPAYVHMRRRSRWVRRRSRIPCSVASAGSTAT